MIIALPPMVRAPKIVGTWGSTLTNFVYVYLVSHLMCREHEIRDMIQCNVETTDLLSDYNSKWSYQFTDYPNQYELI